MSNPKVFEFAKEVGMTPLALMDKIREWQLPVKSHMAELEPTLLETIKAKLNEKNSTVATTEKKPVARKKAATPASPAVKSKAVKTNVTKAGAVKATAKPTAEEVAKATTPSSASVVRRKKPTEAEIAAAAAIAKEEADAQAAEAAEIAAASAAAQAPVEKIETPVAAAQPEAAEVKAAEPEEATVAPATPAPVTPAAASAPAAARKKEVAIGNSGVASAPARRNIIGRMDLSRVQQQGGPGGGSRPDNRNNNSGPGGSPRPSFGGGGTSGGPMRSKGNLRTGFVQAAVVPDIVEINDDGLGRKKDEKRRNKSIATEATPVKPPVEGEAVKHFDAAEFRKREMVFQPKKKKGLLSRPSLQTKITTPKASKRVIKVNQTMKVADLAVEMGIKAPELVKTLMKQGVMASMTMDLDFDTIALIVPEFGFEAQNSFQTAEEVILKTAFGEINAEPITRAPVVTIMGHVDHGKTSLLDCIRNANVAAGEAGGITQHIGAYQVKTETGHTVTFLDTPGHEAFTAMRARGANVTDIAIIVVAADDGVMPQTAEAINHAKSAGVPMIIAVNKMDKPGANPEKIKQQLTEYEVVPEEWGGNTIFVGVSALKKTGIKELLEQIHLIAEVSELKANPKRSATGTVIESKLEKGRGHVATVLVQDGTLKAGQHIVAGAVYGKVRHMMNDRGEKVMEAGPGVPVEILGLDGMPQAGDQFDAVLDEKTAEEVVRIRKDQILRSQTPAGKVSLEDIFSKVKQGDVKELNLILKADVAGSLEAIIGMFSKASTPEVKLKVIHSAVGAITENDVLLASTAKGIVVGFNVRPDNGGAQTAKRLSVDVRTYSIVYEMMDEIRKAMTGLLTPDVVEKVMGRAEVRNTFSVPKIGTIAGTFVSDGKVQRSNMVRLLRDGKIVYEGKISSLKRFKDDAKEVAQGFECGIGIENFNDVKVGDVIEAFVKEEVARELSTAGTPAQA